MELQNRYEEILEGKLNAEDVDAIKEKLGEAYVERGQTEANVIEGLRAELGKQKDEVEKLKKTLEDTQAQANQAQASSAAAAAAVANGTAAGGDQAAAAAAATINGKTLQQQIADFDIMKKSLMRDLQNRCERVVELEISLDETREQYKNVVQSSNNRAQQKKMAFLERNLEQLTHVQRQLVEQNGSLKREVAIAERKLIARNERIESLETLLQDSQEKLTAANHRFETQLAAVKERLDAARLNNPRGLTAESSPFPGSRIAKPLRGGGAIPSSFLPYSAASSSTKKDSSLSSPPLPAQVTGLQSEEGVATGNGSADAAKDSAGKKRSSWFFNQR
ncbi:hypothetical protein KEM55_007410 [Ascosphaera atra]|nr:hypothetical protein KEM55_007410 [Ascosphaera atra]